MKRLLRYLPLLLLLAAPVAALASDGYVVRSVSLRAGPDTDYPRITVLGAGTRVSILGCVDNWEWCDVAAYGERGWVFGRYVQYDHEGRRVYLHDYGSRVGIPIISFMLGSYWGEHYHDRPWYRHRDSWASSSHGHRPRYSYPMQYARARPGDSLDRRTFGRTAPAQTYTPPQASSSREVIGRRTDSQRISGSRDATHRPAPRVTAPMEYSRAREPRQVRERQARPDTRRSIESSNTQPVTEQARINAARRSEPRIQQQQQHRQRPAERQQRSASERTPVAGQSPRAARSTEGQGRDRGKPHKDNKDNKDRNDG